MVHEVKTQLFFSMEIHENTPTTIHVSESSWISAEKMLPEEVEELVYAQCGRYPLN